MGKTMGNKVRVKLDPENDIIETKSGFKLQIDISYEPEKHIVRCGTVTALPTKLYYNKDGSGMPWKTNMELKIGDRVVMYYLAVQNCLSPERRWFIRENKETSIFIEYRNLFAAIRDGQIIPINGYVLVEHIEDPAWEETITKMKSLNLEIPDMRELSKKNVSYGKVAYIGEKNQEYVDNYKSDENYDLKVGDKVIMKKVRDIPMEYDYHAKIDGGRKLFRMHRHDILSKL